MYMIWSNKWMYTAYTNYFRTQPWWVSDTCQVVPKREFGDFVFTGATVETATGPLDYNISIGIHKATILIITRV